MCFATTANVGGMNALAVMMTMTYGVATIAQAVMEVAALGSSLEASLSLLASRV